MKPELTPEEKVSKLEKTLAKTRQELKIARATTNGLQIKAKGAFDRSITEEHAAFLVKYYYKVQDYRIAAGHMLSRAVEPNEFICTVLEASEAIEEQVRFQLGGFALTDPVGLWLNDIFGIGPVLSSGILAHVSIDRCPAPSSLWRYAGYDPTTKKEKGKKLPWNDDLKVVCWKIGQSFMKFSTNPKCFYGRLYRERKEWEVERNNSGANAEYAAMTLRQSNFEKDNITRKALQSGRLSDAHVDARARRWVVKIFLSHVWEVMWMNAHPGERVPRPYIFEHMGHVHKIEPPGVDILAYQKLAEVNRAKK